MRNNLFKIGITHGDFNGVGYEVLLKTLSDDRIFDLFTPIVYGAQEFVEYYQRLLSIELSRQIKVIGRATDATDGVINLIPISTGGVPTDVTPGEATRPAGILAVRALMKARDDVMAGNVDALVTAPINKDMTWSPEFQYPGHTEFFADPYSDSRPLMLFSMEGLPVVGLLTTHIPISMVSETITKELLTDYLLRFEKALSVDFGIPKPRIAVEGLNPHAGEGGMLGSEEVQIIAPVVRELFDKGMLVFGPYSSDGLWGSGAYRRFDAVVAMYHDQGLIPFKLLAMNGGVNVTSGLPIVRTSPDHGTAYDIAGKGEASPTSFRAAIYKAIDILRSRKLNAEITANPLVDQYSTKTREDRRR